GREPARYELLGAAVERATSPARALADLLPQRERIAAPLASQREDLGQRGLDDIARAVVDELRDRARADRPDIVGLITDGIEHRLVALEDGLVAPDPEGEPPRLGPARAAAHRSVQHMDPPRREARVDPADEGGRVGRQIEVDLARREPCEK